MEDNKVCPVCGTKNYNIVFTETNTYECISCKTVISKDDEIIEYINEEEKSE